VSTQPSSRVIRQRRFVALVAGVVVVLAVLLVVRGFACGGPPPFNGTWNGSDPTLGSTTLRISQGADSTTYTVSGLSPAGVQVKTMKLDDGALNAGGDTTQGPWSVQLRLMDDERQMTATYRPPGGGAAVDLRFTRAVTN
jgi:hypothetical protein